MVVLRARRCVAAAGFISLLRPSVILLHFLCGWNFAGSPLPEQTIFAILTALQKLCSAAIGNVLPSSSQAPYRSLRRERQISFTSLLLLSPQNLRFCRDPEWQPLSAVSGRKRYNTLDFAGQNRVPTGCCSPLLDDPVPRECFPLDTFIFLHTMLHKLKNALRKQCEEKQKGSPYRRAMQSSF